MTDGTIEWLRAIAEQKPRSVRFLSKGGVPDDAGPGQDARQILGAFSIESPSLTLSEIVARHRSSACPPCTASSRTWPHGERSNATTRHRYVIGLRDSGSSGMLSPRSYQQRALVVPFLEQLFLETREQVVLSVFHPDGDIVIEQVLGWRDADFSSRVSVSGSRCTHRRRASSCSPSVRRRSGRLSRGGRYGGSPRAPSSIRPRSRRLIERVRSDLDRRSAKARSSASTNSMSAPVFGHRGELYGAVTRSCGPQAPPIRPSSRTRLVLHGESDQRRDARFLWRSRSRTLSGGASVRSVAHRMTRPRRRPRRG